MNKIIVVTAARASKVRFISRYAGTVVEPLTTCQCLVGSLTYRWYINRGQVTVRNAAEHEAVSGQG